MSYENDDGEESYQTSDRWEDDQKDRRGMCVVEIRQGDLHTTRLVWVTSAGI